MHALYRLMASALAASLLIPLPAKATKRKPLRIQSCTLKSVLLPEPLPKAEIIASVLSGKTLPARKYIRRVKIHLRINRYLPAQDLGPCISIQAGKQSADNIIQAGGGLEAYVDRMPKATDRITLRIDLEQLQLSASDCNRPQNPPPNPH